MKKLTLLLAAILVYLAAGQVFAQDANYDSAKAYLDTKGEVYFTFSIDSPKELNKLTRIISIDKVQSNQIYAYANQTGFDEFLSYDYQFEVLEHPGDMLKNPQMHDGSKAIWDFDTYPTYSEYENMMYSFETNFPELCRIVEIGTTPNGHKLLFAVISDSVDVTNMEPRFMYTSSMHGDETTGYVLMLRMINYLLSNYGTNPEATDLVDNTEIWIMPLENPDGTFASGDNSVSGSTRFNSNGVDNNRNYPNPVGGDHPDGEVWQPEVIAMMNIVDSLHFVMSANCHGGIELVNYPFDSWTSSGYPHPDDNWWYYVSQNYADTVHLVNTGYLTGMNNGVTHGGDWYVVYGSRQDYLTCFVQGREFTLELDNTKTTPENELLAHWDYNWRSMIAYMKEPWNGFYGTITDSITGDPLAGTVVINGHDDVYSYTVSELPHGGYWRPIFDGTYQVTYDADGYEPKTYTVNVTNGNGTLQNARLGTAVAIADFTADDSVFCSAPADVQFTNLSADATSWLWDFGDGNTSTEQHPLHTYTVLGQYDVQLIAYSAAGNDTITRPAYIDVDTLNPCSVQIPATGEGPQQTSCDGILMDNGGEGNYTDNTDASITIAPDGASSVTLNFISFDFENNYDYLYVYDGPDTGSPLIGQYTGTNLPNGGTITSSFGFITIRQYTDGGVVSSGFELTWSCVLPSSPPNSDFVANVTSSCTGEVQFSDLSTNGPLNWFWDFGDGNLSNDQNPFHAYTTSGTYTVILTASNSFGSNILEQTDYITINLPSAPLTTGDTRCGTGPVSLSATGSGNLFWYDDATIGSLVNTGTSYNIPSLDVTTIFYVEDQIIQPSQYVGETNNSTNGGIFTSTPIHYLVFDCYSPVTLVSVEVNAQGAGIRTISLQDNNGTAIQSIDVDIPDGTSRIDLNFDIPVGTDLRLAGPPAPDLFRSNAGLSFPYDLPGLISISRSSATTNPTGYYYYFYDWEVKEPACSSARIPVTATINSIPNASISGETSICIGDNITLTATGGTDYAWDSGQNTSDISVTPNVTTSYTVTVTENGCSSTANHSVTVNDNPVADAGTDQLVCSGQSVTIGGNPTAASGTSPYTYSWDNASSLDDDAISNPTSSTSSTVAYSLTVTDVNSCSDVDTILVTVNSSVTVNLAATNESTTGAADGQIIANTNGGETPYTYLWSNSESTQTISNLSAGDYSVTVTSANGCSVTDNVTIIVSTVNPPFAGFTAAEQQICQDTYVQFTDQSTNSPTIWYWEFEGGNPATSTEQNPQVLYSSAGLFNVTLVVENIDGVDTLTLIDFITVFELPSVNFNIVNESIAGAGDGSIDALPVTGTSPFFYQWDNSETTAEIDSLFAGGYYVTIVDANGCVGNSMATVGSETPAPVADFSASPQSVCSSSLIQFTDLSIYNPSSWLWSFEGGVPATSTNQNPAVLYTMGGIFDVSLIVTNSDGADTLSMLDYITIYENPSVTFNVINESFPGEGDGSVTTIPVTGVSPFVYQWSNSETTSGIDSLTLGHYELTIADANGCSSWDSVYVGSDTPPPSAAFSASPQILCAGGQVQFTDLTTNYPSSWIWSFEGGTPEYSTEQNPVITYNTGGAFEVTLLVSNGYGSANIAEPSFIEVSQMSLTFDTTHESYDNAYDGAATVIIAGGISPYIYNWNNGENTSTIDSLTAGTYSVVILDAANCIVTGPVIISTLVGIDENTSSSYTIYPNPSKGQLFIDNPVSEIFRFDITDMLGRNVLSNENTEVFYTIDLSSFNPGVYTINVVTHSGIRSHKIILSR